MFRIHKIIINNGHFTYCHWESIPKKKKKRLLGSQIKMNNVCIPTQASEASKSILG
jgi:hypothetical protein